MRKLYFKILNRYIKWKTALKENEQLKKEMASLAMYRNQLLEIIVTSSRIVDIGRHSEPLFIGIKETGNSIIFHLYDYNPVRLAAATININGENWELLSIETTKNKPTELKMILLAFIQNEAEKNNRHITGPFNTSKS